MNNDYFIGMLKYCETSRIKAFRGTHNFISKLIPDALGLLLPDIVKLLEQNLYQICHPKQGMVIFTMQPASAMLTSSQPLILERHIDGFRLDHHFCCTLEYILAPIEKLDCLTAWDHTCSIIIDFTTGETMDSDCYVSHLMMTAEQGKNYGKINQDALAIAWKVVKVKQQQAYHQAYQKMNFRSDAKQGLLTTS